ncbi:MAG: GrpB family protein, partial [Selenomonadaceae bacterium]|nr:GrpB family protein [Selenomonadaceae bacterium]
MINLEKWNPEWLERFTSYEASLTPLFPGATLHHIGATSIRGLSAQPIIDMLLLVKDEAAVWSAVDTLVEQGYTYIGTERNTETLFTGGAKMYVTQGTEQELLIFRDILAADPRVMWAYKQVKESAAPRGELAYNAAKGNFVEAVIRAYKQGREAPSSESCKRKAMGDAMSG